MSLSANVKNWIRKTFTNNDAAAAMIAAIDAATATNGSQAAAIAAAQADATAALNTAYRDNTVLIPVEDLAAGADIASRVAFCSPLAGQIVSAAILAVGVYAGVDAGNTMVVALTDGAGNAIVSKTFNNAVIPLDNGMSDLGALDATNKVLLANETVKMAITNGATANPPALFLVLQFRPTAV